MIYTVTIQIEADSLDDAWGNLGNLPEKFDFAPHNQWKNIVRFAIVEPATEKHPEGRKFGIKLTEEA